MCWGALLTTCVLACPPTRVMVYANGPEMCCSPGVPAPIVYREVPCCVQTIPASATLSPVPVEPDMVLTAVAATTAPPATAVATTPVAASSEALLAPPPVPPSTMPATAAVLADQALTSENAVATETNADDSVLENAASSAGFGPTLGLDHLALGWGVSTIGNGTLYPNPARAGFGGGIGGLGPLGGGSPGSGSNGASNSSANPSNVTTIIINNGGSTPPSFFFVPPGTTPAGQPPGPHPEAVPEPASYAVWGTAALAFLAWRRRGSAKVAAA